MAVLEDYNIDTLLKALCIENTSKTEYTLYCFYWRFLKSNHKELSLYVPIYDEILYQRVYENLKGLLFIYTILESPVITDFKGTSLFNIFNYKREDIKLFLDYKAHKNGMVLWDNYTLTHANDFNLIFKECDLLTLNQNQIEEGVKALVAGEKFLKLCKKHLRNIAPRYVNLSAITNLVFVPPKVIFPKLLFEELSQTSKFQDLSEAADEEDRLGDSINLGLGFQYPYSRQPHSYVVNAPERYFQIIFQNRFAYKEIAESDIVLLPQEIAQERISITAPYEVVSTGHQENLYTLLMEFKNDWDSLELNKFTYPFPKYWLMFINQGEKEDTWIASFCENYPTVANSLLMDKIKKIIHELYKLDWFYNFLNREENKCDYVFVFPKKKRVQDTFVNKAYSSLKKYIYQQLENIDFVDSLETICSQEPKDVFLLNSYDVISLANILQQRQDNLRIIYPDFLFFSYKPKLPLYLYKYQYYPLFAGMRNTLDFTLEQEHYKEKYSEIKNKLDREYSEYQKKYLKIEQETLLTDDDDDSLPVKLSKDIDDELVLNEAEELQLYKYKGNESYTLVITTTTDETYELLSMDKLYIVRNSIIYTYAKELEKGDLFFTSEDMRKLLSDKYLNKITQMPKSVQRYQVALSKINNCSNLLLQKGMDYKTEESFLNKIIPEEKFEPSNFILPRAKKNWEVICDLLDIDDDEMEMAYMIYFNRRKIERLKELYKDVINVLNQLSLSFSPSVVNKVEEILQNYFDVYEQEENQEEFNLEKKAKSLIQNIARNISFREVENLIHK